MAQQVSKTKTKRWLKRRYYMNKREFVSKQKAWDRAIIAAEQNQKQKQEQLKKAKENRKSKKGK